MPKDIPESIIAGAAMGGGQTQEHIQYDTETQVWVPIMQAIALVPCVCALIGGILLFGYGVRDLARLAESGWDLLLFAVLIVLGVTAAAGLALAVVRKLAQVSERTTPPWLSLVAYAGGILWVMALLNTLRLVDGRWTVFDTLRVVGGIGLLVSGILLTYRIANELYNPLYPPSPTTKMLERYIDAQLAAQEPERVMVRRPIPVNAGNHRGELDWMREAEPEPQPADETRIDEDFVDLVAMVRRAVTVGWARTQWITRPRLSMPSGRKMDRGLYDALVALAASPWRIIAKSGKSGVSAEWLMPPELAVALLDRAYEAQFGADGTVLPVEETE